MLTAFIANFEYLSFLFKLDVSLQPIDQHHKDIRQIMILITSFTWVEMLYWMRKK